MSDNPDGKVYDQDLAKLAARQAAQKAAEQAASSSTAAPRAAQYSEPGSTDAQPSAATTVIAHHRVTGDETLSHLSLKYYGHTTEPYWRLIYEFNKAKIGPDYKNIYDGLVLDIPELPVNLK